MVLKNSSDGNFKEIKKVGYIFTPNSFPDTIRIKFTDEFQYDGKVKKFSGLADINSFCTTHFHKLLLSYNIPTAYIDSPSTHEIVFIKHQPLPLNVRIYNYSNKILNKIFNSKDETKLPSPIYEIYHINCPKYPLNEYHLLSFNLMSIDESRELIKLSSKINVIIKSFFERRGYDLLTLELEFGKNNSQLILTKIFTIDSFKLKPHNFTQQTLDLDKIPPAKLKEVFISFQKMIY